MKQTIVIHSVITKKNYNKIKELMLFAKEKGADKLELTQIMSFSKIVKELRLNQEELEEFKKSIPELLFFSKKINLKTNLEEYAEGDLIKKSECMDELIKKDVYEHKFQINCFNPWTNLIILNNGDVGPCCLYTPDKKIGNIHESSLKEIWLGKRLEKFRNKIRTCEISSCKDCPSTEVIRNRRLRENLEKNVLFRLTKLVKNEI